MSNNLKVNAKTKPLGLKKKHNLLVEKVEDVEREIPSSQEITNLANVAIQADKDILSQIVYDHELDTITFPLGIVPLAISTDDTVVYFNFADNLCYNNNNVCIEDVSMTFSHNKLHITGLDAVYSTETEISFMYYLSYSGDGAEIMDTIPFDNTYYVFHPITSAGTKLYAHGIKIEDSNGDAVYFYLIVNNSTEILSLSDLRSRILSGINYLSSQALLINDNRTNLIPLNIGVTTTNLIVLIAYDASSGSESMIEINSFTTDEEIFPL